MNQSSVSISSLLLDHASEALAYWQIAHPLHPLEPWMLRERFFGPPPPDPELLLAARDASGRLLGIAAGVYPCRRDGVGGVRWVGALPGEKGILHIDVIDALLKELCYRLGLRGAGEVHIFATPPHYLRPGVDTRETLLIAALQDLGWVHAAT